MTHSGGKPHNVGDKGQRYEISYYCPTEKRRKVFGWTDKPEAVCAMISSIALHPTMESPLFTDRQP